MSDEEDFDLSLKKKKKSKKKKPKADAEAEDAEEPAVVDDDDDDDLSLKKKKKKKKKPKADLDDEEEAEEAAPADDDDDDDLSLKKKKKKKKKKVDASDEGGDDDGELGLKKKKKKKKKKKAMDDDDDDEDDAAGGDCTPWGGTDRDYLYSELLDRAYVQIRRHNPENTEGGGGARKKHSLPPPLCSRDGTKKTVFTNFNAICQCLHRTNEHVLAFLLTELGTSGSIDGEKRLILKGRFMPKALESVLKKYIVQYVMCSMCRSPDTALRKEASTRLFFLDCSSCGASRSVEAIKAGFKATSRADRRAKKAAMV